MRALVCSGTSRVVSLVSRQEVGRYGTLPSLQRSVSNARTNSNRIQDIASAKARLSTTFRAAIVSFKFLFVSYSMTEGFVVKDMGVKFGYTGIRVRDLDGAIAFFTKFVEMKVRSRVKADWTKGEFASLISAGGKHWLELNWYADDSPVASPFHEGEELDHLGFEVDDFEGLLKKLNGAGYPTKIGPTRMGVWEVAFVQGFENIWLDVYRIRKHVKHRK